MGWLQQFQMLCTTQYSLIEHCYLGWFCSFRVILKLKALAQILSHLFSPSKRYPTLQNEFTDLIIKLAIEINNSFLSDDISINIETPMRLRTVVERIPVGLDLYKNASDPLHETWKNMVLPHVNPEDLDHYSTLWNTVVRNGPNIKPSL